MKINPNHPAFLTEPKTFYLRPPPPDCDTSFGLTKREYFAAMAMQGIMFWDATVNEPHETGKVKILAHQAVTMANALIAELNTNEKK